MLLHVILHAVRAASGGKSNKLTVPKSDFLGFWADHCPVCHDVRTFRVSMLRTPAGNLFREQTCESCCVVLPATAVRDIARSATNDINALIRQTNARLVAAHADHAERNARARVSSAERFAAIADAFATVRYMIERRSNWPIVIDIRGGLALVGTILGVIAAAAVAHDLQLGQTGTETACLAGAGLGITCSAYLFATQRRRHLRRHITPVLAMALRPLEPSRDEIESALADLRARGLSYRWLSVAALCRALHQRHNVEASQPASARCREAVLDTGIR